MSGPMNAVRQTLDVLRRYYADRDGKPHALNAEQIAVYLDGLARFSDVELEAAARQHMRQSAFFPKLSELLAILDPKADLSALAHLAWAELEREARRIGAYRTVEFMNPEFGEAVRQVFGSWASVCSMDTTSPAWAIKRQTFLQVFPLVAARTDLDHVTLYGLDRHGQRDIIGHLRGLPDRRHQVAALDRSRDVLAEVKRRFQAVSRPTADE